MSRSAALLAMVLIGAVLTLRATAQQPSSPTAQQPASATAILPGRSIGPFELGMALDRAKGMMDQYGSVEEVDSPTVHGFCNPERGAGICAFDRWQRLELSTPGSVVFVLTDDPRFATQAGGHTVGQPLLNFLRTYGLYTSGQGSELRWEARGLTVDVVPGDSGLQVRVIGVFTPRGLSARRVP